MQQLTAANCLFNIMWKKKKKEKKKKEMSEMIRPCLIDRFQWTLSVLTYIDFSLTFNAMQPQQKQRLYFRKLPDCILPVNYILYVQKGDKRNLALRPKKTNKKITQGNPTS